MMRHRDTDKRRGTTVPLFAILLVPLLGMLAFSLAIGWVTLVRTDLQTAADAAALAGAEKLQELYVQYTMPNQPCKQTILTTATTNTSGSPMATAERFARYNKAGNVSVTVSDQDVSFGFTDAQGTYHSNYSSYNGGFPNTITVVTRRDKTVNSPVSLFFGPILGLSSKELTATASATIYSGDVTSLQAIQGVNAHVLPVALDVNIWQSFYQTGLSPDGTIHTAANGYPELQVYPCPSNEPGSFSLLDVGPPAAKTKAFKNWITNGSTPNDINYLLGNGLLPVSLNSPKNWPGKLSIKNSLLSAFQGELGVPNLLPLFAPVQTVASGSYQAASGTSSTKYFAIVGFAGICVSEAMGNMSICVQPCAVIDPTAVIPNPKPVGTQTSQFGSPVKITTFISAKLTQ